VNKKFDLVLKNGFIIDGTGCPGYYSDIGISGDRIYTISTGLYGKEEISAEGLIITPGFIDIHTHSEQSLLCNSRAESKITQGVTLEVLGNCGSSSAPVPPKLISRIEKTLWRDYEIKLNWSTVADYIAKLSEKGVALNYYFLVGHSNLRYLVDALGENITKSQLSEMQMILRSILRSREAGGLSTGLIYPPSCFASTEELIALARVLAEEDALYTSHIRDEGDKLESAIEEAITIGREGGVVVEISHLKASGKRNWGKVEKAISCILEARKEGVKVFADAYPYLAGATGLSAVLPKEVFNEGKEVAKQRLKEDREKLISYLNPRDDWEGIIVSEVSRRDWQGRSIKELAYDMGKTPQEFVIDLLLEEDLEVGAIFFSMCQEDVDRVITTSFVSIGSDSVTSSPTGILSKSRPHPRTYGTFPKFFNYYVKEKKLLTLQEAVRKVTSMPAYVLGLKERGKVEEGYFADLTVFSLDNLKDTATYSNPHSFSIGIEWVLVNGIPVIANGKFTDKLPGREVKREKAFK